MDIYVGLCINMYVNLCMFASVLHTWSLCVSYHFYVLCIVLLVVSQLFFKDSYALEHRNNPCGADDDVTSE